ncbi:toxin-antitoxin system, toxin component [Streptomyces xanthophaeus]|uniref:toxin-antitoxin system, toxin component n=1 Tax=Streptomyces xanthophaeus TaxID=67385 RepID=UPI003715A3FF
MWDEMMTSRTMKRHRDELFAGAMRPVDQTTHDLMRSVCAHLTETDGRQVRLILEPFPPDTVSGLWLDLGDHEVVVVEKNTLPLHQMVILGHELWHRKEASLGRRGANGTDGTDRAVAAAARMLGDRWNLGDAVSYVSARTDYDLEEERRAERFGRLLAAKFLPFLLGARSSTPPDAMVGRIRAALGR